MKFAVNIIVTYKESVLEPQGQAMMLSYANRVSPDTQNNIENIRVGKYIQLNIDASSEAEAITKSEEITESLLHNPVMEKYEVHVNMVEGGSLS